MLFKFYNNKRQCLNFIFIIIIIYLRVFIGETKESKNGAKNQTKGAHLLKIGRATFPFWDPSDFFNIFDVFQQREEEKSFEKDEELPSNIEEDLDRVILLKDLAESPDDLLSISNNSAREEDMEKDGGVGEEQADDEDGGDSRFSIPLIGLKNKTQIRSRSPPSHIILVPGLGGSRLEARWNKSSVPRIFCDKISNWIDIWFNLRLLLPYVIECFLDNFRLEYDHATNTTRDSPGVELRVKTPNRISHIENLIDFGPIEKGYYAAIVRRLISKQSGFNYMRDISLIGAPYDFRKAPNELQNYFENLKSTSEENYRHNDLKPVTYICHSMGCSMMLYFFQRQSQEWKDKHVKRLISIAGPWAGAMLAMKAATSGYALGVPIAIDEKKLAHVERSLPAIMFLFPHNKLFKGKPLIISNIRGANATSGGKQSLFKPSDVNKPLKRPLMSRFRSVNHYTNKSHDNRIHFFKNPHKEIFTLDNMKQFFDAIDYPTGYKMWLQTKDLLGSLEPPRVEVWCIVGRGFKTLTRLDYLGKFPNSDRVEIFDEGDGTVSLESASYCKNWAHQQAQPVYYKELPASHIGLLENAKLLDLIVKIIRDEANKEPRG